MKNFSRAFVNIKIYQHFHTKLLQYNNLKWGRNGISMGPTITTIMKWKKKLLSVTTFLNKSCPLKQIFHHIIASKRSNSSSIIPTGDCWNEYSSLFWKFIFIYHRFSCYCWIWIFFYFNFKFGIILHNLICIYFKWVLVVLKFHQLKILNRSSWLKSDFYFMVLLCFFL